ncbi:hypothetical protein G4O51_09540 [Candidatus Bathyarchaeota archaeon A05DMB-2]|jgi:hypothetical protein|nr:hypothetical protein [Candidatus Bathyarchaeota archaeon A05DMB-2]
MQTEKIELDERFGKEYAGCYVFSEISWAKRSRIIQKHTKYHPLTGQVVSSDFITIQAETIWASLKEQPPNKPITLEKLLNEENGISIGLGELFSQIVNKLNSVTQEETTFLSEQSADKNQTQPSQNSASAKNSGGHRSSSEDSQPKPSNNSSRF